ncbi:MAG: SulP family inorganic anion transporter [Polyangiales bacterium]|jgi:MFS superfamily sulfate permease-like transporter
MSKVESKGGLRSAVPVADLKAGFLVFLIALPLSLGIAMASGFPPISGVLTAIIGGMVVTFLGSARLTIKGPAAGLIVIALGAVQELGQGDPMLGYRRALAIGVAAACVQIVLALLRSASIGVAMSPSVVHGMLAAIGVIIISKQAHTLVGVAPEAREPLELLLEIPQSVAHANPEILALGILSLLILFGWPLIRQRWAKALPAPVVVLAVTVPLSLWLDLDHSHAYRFLSHQFHVGPEFLVQLPGSLLDAVVFPDFSMLFSLVSLKYVVMFALVGTIESTLSVLAVDLMDPEKRASNLNRDLLALSVGNLGSSLLGGLPMISEIVRSKANVDAGAKSHWANFFHGAFLLGFVALAPGLLSEIPLAALAAMLVYTGAKLASPRELLHVKHIGVDQLALFLTTLLVTLATDLLVGVAAGLLLKLILHRARGATFKQLFRTQVVRIEDGSELRLTLHGAAAFTSLLAVRKALSNLDPSFQRVVIDVRDVAIVDHTFLSRVEGLSNEWPNAELEIVGIDALTPHSPHPHSTRRKASG